MAILTLRPLTANYGRVPDTEANRASRLTSPMIGAKMKMRCAGPYSTWNGDLRNVRASHPESPLDADRSRHMETDA